MYSVKHIILKQISKKERTRVYESLPKVHSRHGRITKDKLVSVHEGTESTNSPVNCGYLKHKNELFHAIVYLNNSKELAILRYSRVKRGLEKSLEPFVGKRVLVTINRSSKKEGVTVAFYKT